jgi:SET domain-containing protein
MFRSSKDKVIDATFKGSEARYLNHSCDVKIYFVLFIILYSLSQIVAQLYWK